MSVVVDFDATVQRVANREQMAVVYAQMLADESDSAMWRALNAAIVARWSLSGLAYIKRLAWAERETS